MKLQLIFSELILLLLISRGTSFKIKLHKQADTGNATVTLAFASTALSLMMYSYVVSSTLNLVARIWLCILRRMAGEPLYATTTTDGAHFSNSSTQLDSVLQNIIKYMQA